MATAREQFLAKRAAQKSESLDTAVTDRAPGYTDTSVTSTPGVALRPSTTKALATHGQKLRALSDELGGRITHLGGTAENVDALRKAATHVDTANRHITAHMTALAQGDHAAAAVHFSNAATQLSSAANALPKISGKAYSNLTSDKWAPKGQQWHDPSDKDSTSLENIHPKINKISNDLWTGLKSVGAKLPETASEPPRVTEHTAATPAKDINLGISTALDASLTPDTIPAPPHRTESLIPGGSKRRKVPASPAVIPTPAERTEAPATRAAMERNIERPAAPKIPKSLKERGETGRRQFLDLADQTRQHWHEQNRRVTSFTESDYKNADGSINKDAAAAARPSADDMKEFGGDKSSFFTSTAYKNPAAYAQRHGLNMRDALQIQTTRRADTRLTGLESVNEADRQEPKNSRSEAFHNAAIPTANGTEIRKGLEPGQFTALSREVLFGVDTQTDNGDTVHEAGMYDQVNKNARAEQKGAERIAAREGVLRRRAEVPPAPTPRSELEQTNLAKSVTPKPSPEGRAAAAAAQVREAGRNTPAAPNRGPEATAIARTRASAADKARKSRMEAFLGGQAK